MNRQLLIDQARECRSKAYAPYSSYHVGAAILGKDGKVYLGANIENISFGLTVCAERNAVAAMVMAGCHEIESVVVATKDGGTPCGACRQVLAEFCPDPSKVVVLCVGEASEMETTLANLLPSGFTTALG